MEIIDEWKLAYLGGMIDGDGSIQIRKHPIRKARKSHEYQLVVTVANTDRRLLDWLKENFGGGIHTKKREENWSECYEWALQSPKAAYELLKNVKPYFVIKGEQAEVAIEFFETTKRNRVSGGRVPVWLNNKREEYYQKMKDLHL